MTDDQVYECIVCGETLEPGQKKFCGPGCRRSYRLDIEEGGKDDFSDRLRDGFDDMNEDDTDDR